MMRWVFSKICMYKRVLSTLEDYCTWIGAQSTALVLLKVNCQHVKACTDPDFEVSVDNVKRSAIDASEWGKSYYLIYGTKAERKLASKNH